MLKGTKKYVRQGPWEQESRSPRNFNTLSGRAHVMFVLCAAAHIVATIAQSLRDLRIQTLSPNQFLTPKITHPSPAALCAILPTWREDVSFLQRFLHITRRGRQLKREYKPKSQHSGSEWKAAA